MSAAEERVEIAPQPGPQTMFADCEADVAIYGGAAGGGKSWALLYEAAKWVHLRKYRAILFRRTVPELTGGGGLWDESFELYSHLEGRQRAGNNLDWTFPKGARIEFRHMAREADRKSHQGRQYALIGFDELTHFTAAQFWYLLSRNRTSIKGFRPYVRATCNPDPDSFVADLIAWWIDEDGYPIPERAGVVRYFVRLDEALHWYDTREAAAEAHPDQPSLSFTFIPSRLRDNPKLLEADPGYRGRLMNLDRVTRARLIGDEERGGNWRVRAAAGLVFKRAEFKIATGPPSPIVRSVRAWDVASLPPSTDNPDPDWTRGVRVSLCENGELWIDDLVSTRTRSAITLKIMRRTAAGPEGPELERLLELRGRVPELLQGDGPSCWIGLWQDPGGAGVIAVDTIRDKLGGFAVETRYTSRDKLAFAKAWSPLVEQGRVYLLRAPWNRVLLSECDGFPEAAHDDIVDAVSLAVQVLLGSGLGFWDSLSEGARQLTEGR